MSLKRKQATSPLSQNWTLYSPKVLAEKLGLPVDKVDQALTECGYNKAVRIREFTIKRKIVLQQEVRDLDIEIRAHQNAIYKLRQRRNGLFEEVTGLRNILRIPRENTPLPNNVVIEELVKKSKLKKVA